MTALAIEPQFLRQLSGIDPAIIPNLIERLIDRLDALDPHEDAEDDDPGAGNVEDGGEEQKFEFARYRHDAIDQRRIYDNQCVGEFESPIVADSRH